ncbi:hypothetical protein OG613_45250 (plasmid) [Streptomyces sp. NBC_00015]|uniref:hypothetical protein n=1 Tax=Streptomyces sp. NBC_00015 TaxID=2903611 RepID=UPI002F90C6A9
MLHQQGAVQAVTDFRRSVVAGRLAVAGLLATALLLFGVTSPIAAAAHQTSQRHAARAHAPLTAPTSPAETPAGEPAPDHPTPSAGQPTTVTQPPGVSGYVPMEYLLPLLALLLISFLATRPGTQSTIKALVKLVFGGGQGTPPV